MKKNKKPTPQKDKAKELIIDFISYKVLAVKTEDPELYVNTKLRKKFPKLPLIPGPFTAVHIDCESYPRQSMIVLPYTALEDPDRILLHELTHAVDHIIEFFGFEGTEIRAYLLDYLFSTFKVLLQDS